MQSLMPPGEITLLLDLKPIRRAPLNLAFRLGKYFNFLVVNRDYFVFMSFVTACSLLLCAAALSQRAVSKRTNIQPRYKRSMGQYDKNTSKCILILIRCESRFAWDVLHLATWDFWKSALCTTHIPQKLLSALLNLNYLNTMNVF